MGKGECRKQLCLTAKYGRYRKMTSPQIIIVCPALPLHAITLPQKSDLCP